MLLKAGLTALAGALLTVTSTTAVRASPPTARTTAPTTLACVPLSELPDTTTAAELVRRGLQYQAGECGGRERRQAQQFFRKGVTAGGGAEYQAWALRVLTDLLVAQGRSLHSVENLLAEAQQRSRHYAWFHAEAWIRFRQSRFIEAAEILEFLVSGRLHHTAWPWAIFYDDLGDTYAALGRANDAQIQWRKALKLSFDSDALANPRELQWDRRAVERKLVESAAQ